MASIRYAVTLDELVALNEEIRSLARAGVPIERGLHVIGQDLPGRLGRLAMEISNRLERGQELSAVLQDPSLALPPVYSAVVAAGVRTGRLPAALESLTRSVQRSADLRRTLVVSLIYPFIVLLIATAVFAFTWSAIFPTMRVVLPGLLDHEMPVWFQWLTWTVDHGGITLAIVWAVLLFLTGLWLIRSRMAQSFGGAGWRPTLNFVNSAGRIATFAETLALLLEHQVNLIDALHLSAAASGDKTLIGAASELADSIRAGRGSGEIPRGIPPLLGWSILSNAPTLQLVKTLRQTARGLRDRALRMSFALAVYLPILLSASIGTVIGLYYAILVMTPFYFLLWQLAEP